MGEGPPLGQYSSGHELSPDRRRREGERHVHHQQLHAGIAQVIEEGPLLDRTEGDRELPGTAPPLEDVIDAVPVRVDPGEEGRPGRPGVGGDGGGEDGPPASIDQGGQVGEDAPFQQRVEDAPVGAIPADEEDS